MKVYFRGKRDALRRKIYQLAAVLAGRQADEHGIAKAFSLGIGQELLNNVHNDYDKMALGQRGEMGYQWQPLSPYTLEHRRGVTKPNPKNIAKYNQWQKDGKQKDYQDAYTKRYEEMLDTLTLTGRGRSDPATIAIAREVATTYATTLIKDTEDIKRKQAYGNVKILIDIGTLYNSLAPGRDCGRQLHGAWHGRRRPANHATERRQRDGRYESPLRNLPPERRAESKAAVAATAVSADSRQ